MFREADLAIRPQAVLIKAWHIVQRVIRCIVIHAAVIAILTESAEHRHVGNGQFLTQDSHGANAFSSQALNDLRFLPGKVHCVTLWYEKQLAGQTGTYVIYHNISANARGKKPRENAWHGSESVRLCETDETPTP